MRGSEQLLDGYMAEYWALRAVQRRRRRSFDHPPPRAPFPGCANVARQRRRARHWVANREAGLVAILRFVLAALGLVMAWSAAEHWSASPELRVHYAGSVLGPRGVWAVAAAQSLAAFGLLWPRFQPVAGLSLGTVMLIAAATHVHAGGVEPAAWSPLGVAAWAIAPALALLILSRRGAR